MREYIDSQIPAALEELAELVSFRSVADAAVEDPEQCRLAAQWVQRALIAEGITDTRVQRTPDGTEAVIGHYQGPQGTPRVLLYAHYDVQPAPAEGWESDPFTLTLRGERYYGRGAADCKGSIIAHLLTLRALRQEAGGQAEYPVSITVVVEGSEEQGTGGLEEYVRQNPEDLRSDVIIIGDSGNIARGVPTLTVSLRGVADVIVTVRTLEDRVHSGSFGGAAPDALAALIHMLGTLRDDDGNTTITGVDNTQRWEGVEYSDEAFRRDAGALEGTELLGSGSVADQVWARPAVTILGIDAPGVTGAVPAVNGRAAAKLNLRVPPGMDAATAQQALIDHLTDVVPWGAQVSVEPAGLGDSFKSNTDTRAYELLSEALAEAFGAPAVAAGQGGAIPLTAELARQYPQASVVMIGLSEPEARIHAANESVHPAELAGMAHAQALFLQRLSRS